ncbi:MAG TPA: glycosyltransferase family 2 protein [Acidimicrobiales bacterium]
MRSLMSASVLAIVPALNEESTVSAVVQAIRSELSADVLVVDDGSTDLTGEKARAAGAIVARHPFNLGVGAALRTGFRYADSAGYPIVIQVDADGQHVATEAHQLLELVRSGSADIAVGSRFAEGAGDYGVGRMRRFSMRVLSRIVSRRLGTHITDTTSGFRAFGRVAIVRYAQAYPTAYLSDTVEALLLAKDWGLRVVEVPVAMRERMGGQASNNVVKSVYHLCRLMLVIVVHPLRRPLVGGANQ